MSKLANMPQSKEAKEKYYHPIVDILLDKVNKEGLCEALHCSERLAREVVAECAMHYPVVTYSSSKGYRRAKNIDSLTLEQLQAEISEVDKAINDYSSRIKCLKKREKPLIAWKKVAEKRLNQMKEELNNETNN